MPASDQGSLKDRYTLIPRTLIFITRGESVLLIKGAPHKRLWANRYNGVGGHVERGEDVLSAAHRELAEETGLRDCRLWLCGVITVDASEAAGIAIFVLRGSYAGGELQPSQEGSLEWVPTGEISRLPLVEDLGVLLPRVLAAGPGDPPFAAQYTYASTGRLQIQFGSS
jgi:8-oxo-dGTP diphosphatase